MSFELSETSGIILDRIIDYCNKNDIPLFKEEGLLSLVRKVRYLAKEIENINSSTFNPQKSPIRRFLTGKESDADLTEPES